MKKGFKLIIIICLMTLTGCFKTSSMEDITIYTTTYPIEYVVNRLYGDHSTVKSIYPNGYHVNKLVTFHLWFDETNTKERATK